MFTGVSEKTSKEVIEYEGFEVTRKNKFFSAFAGIKSIIINHLKIKIMKATVFFKGNGLFNPVTIDGKTEEEVCEKAFNLEELLYDKEIWIIKFGNGKRIFWNSTFAHYCWGEGRICFLKFKEACKSEFEERFPSLKVKLA